MTTHKYLPRCSANEVSNHPMPPETNITTNMYRGIEGVLQSARPKRQRDWRVERGGRAAAEEEATEAKEEEEASMEVV